MATAAVVLKFEDRRLHAFKRVGSDLIWFVLADVCEILGIVDPTTVPKRLDGDQKGTHTMRTSGGDQRMMIVSEDAVYEIACTSRKPVAKRFKRWLYREVLPEIRRTGSYQGSTLPLDALIGELQPALDLPPGKVVAFQKPEPNTDDCEQKHEREQVEHLRQSLTQPQLNFGATVPSPAEQALDDLTAEEYYQRWGANDLPRTAADEEVLPRTQGKLGPRICDNPNFIEPRIDEGFLRAITESSRLSDGYGTDDDGSGDRLMTRDEMPTEQTPQAWQAWVKQNWFRLPLKLREHYWRDTDYGNRVPSQELIEAIIAISLP